MAVVDLLQAVRDAPDMPDGLSLEWLTSDRGVAYWERPQVRFPGPALWAAEVLIPTMRTVRGELGPRAGFTFGHPAFFDLHDTYPEIVLRDWAKGGRAVGAWGRAMTEGTAGRTARSALLTAARDEYREVRADVYAWGDRAFQAIDHQRRQRAARQAGSGPRRVQVQLRPVDPRRRK